MVSPMCSHDHEHTHADGVTHTHPHTHDHCHEHTHDHLMEGEELQQWLADHADQYEIEDAEVEEEE